MRGSWSVIAGGPPEGRACVSMSGMLPPSLAISNMVDGSPIVRAFADEHNRGAAQPSNDASLPPSPSGPPSPLRSSQLRTFAYLLFY
jgi:hypothetical protein